LDVVVTRYYWDVTCHYNAIYILQLLRIASVMQAGSTSTAGAVTLRKWTDCEPNTAYCCEY